MGCMPVGASRKLRWGRLSLAAVVTLCAVANDPADARGRKRHFVKRTGMSASASYSPAYAAIVVDAKTGAVLHQAAPDGLRHPASLLRSSIARNAVQYIAAHKYGKSYFAMHAKKP